MPTRTRPGLIDGLSDWGGRRWLLRGDGHTVEKDKHIQYLHEHLPVA